MNTKNGRLSLALSNSLYGLAAIGLIVFGLIYSIVEAPRDGYIYYLYGFLSEFLIVALPALLCILFVPQIRVRVKRNKLRISQMILIFIAACVGIYFINIISLIWGVFLTHLGGEVHTPPTPVASDEVQFIVSIISLAIMPALCEELLFRGVILPCYEKIGRGFAVVFSGILFAILHGQVAALPAHFILGIVIGFIVIETNSLLSGIIYHFTHNGMSLLSVFLIGGGDNQSAASNPFNEIISDIGGGESVYFVVAMGILFFVVGGIFLALIMWIRRIARKYDQHVEVYQSPSDSLIIALDSLDGQSKASLPQKIAVWLPLLPGVLVAVYLYWSDFMAIFGA